MKPFENYECEGQMNLFDYMQQDKPKGSKTFTPQPAPTTDADKLRAKGWKNNYDENPEKSGIYEVCSIEEPDKVKYSHYIGEGFYKGNWTAIGSGAHSYTWWRPDRRKYQRKPVIYHMGLSAYYFECPYCHSQNSDVPASEGTYCRTCFKYFGEGIDKRKTKDLKECEEQLGEGGGAVYKDEKGKWHYAKQN